MFPENTMSFKIKGMDIISQPEFIKFPFAILRKDDIISVHIEVVDGGDVSTYSIIVTTKQKQNEEFCVANYDTEEEAVAVLYDVWLNLNPPLAFSATVDAPDDVVRELKGETKTKEEDEPATFDFLTAVKKLFEGKNVRVCSWAELEHLYYDFDNKCVYDELGRDYSKCITSWVDDVWEEYKDEVV